MLRPLLTAILVLALPQLARAGDDPSQEPPMSYRLHLGGQVVELKEGEQIEAEVAGKPTQIRLEVADVRRFEAAGLSFEYPRAMAFEYEATAEGLRIWTLDGSNVVLMVQHYAGKTKDVKWTDLLEAVRAQFRSMKAKIAERDATLGAGRKALSGRELVLHLGEIGQTQALFPIQTDQGLVVLWLQDSVQDDGGHSAEYARVRAQLERSLRISR